MMLLNIIGCICGIINVILSFYHISHTPDWFIGIMWLIFAGDIFFYRIMKQVGNIMEFRVIKKPELDTHTGNIVPVYNDFGGI